MRRPHGESLRRLADALGLTDEERRTLQMGGADQAGTPDRAELRPCLLPADTVDFTGRAEQVELLEGMLLRDGRSTAVAISALVGQGGIGKTALAVHMAHRLRHAFPDGQLYVDLHGAEHSQPSPGRCWRGGSPRWVWTAVPCRTGRSGGPSYSGPCSPTAGCCSFWTTPPASGRSGLCCRGARRVPSW